MTGKYRNRVYNRCHSAAKKFNCICPGGCADPVNGLRTSRTRQKSLEFSEETAGEV